MEETLKNKIISLRYEEKLTPKVIARILELPTKEVEKIIRETAMAKGETFYKCFVNESSLDWLKKGQEDNNGLIQIACLKQSAGECFKFYGFLIDCYCLGVKNVWIKKRIPNSMYQNFLNIYYKAFDSKYSEISVEEVKEAVFASVQYAKSLGFNNYDNSDTAEALAALEGKWEGKTNLKFGKNNRPYFISGPDDDANKILKTLDENIGKNKYDFLYGL